MVAAGWKRSLLAENGRNRSRNGSESLTQRVAAGWKRMESLMGRNRSRSGLEMVAAGHTAGRKCCSHTKTE